MNTGSVFQIIILLLILMACSKKTLIESTLRNDAFVTVGNLSSGRYGHASVASGNEIYIIGGMQLSTRLLTRNIEIFNVEDYSIKIIPAIITPRRYLVAVTLDSGIYIIGGAKYAPTIPIYKTTISQTTGITEKYDLRTEKLTAVPAMPTPRMYMGVVAYKDKIHVIGRSQFKSFIDKSFISNPSAYFRFLSAMEIYDTKSNTWIEGPSMPTARQCAAVLYRDKIYVIGRYNGYPLPNFEIFDIDKNKWETKKDVPLAMSAYSYVASHGCIYFFGDYNELNRVLVYDIEKDKWLNVESNFKGRRHNTSVCMNNDIYVVGGNISPFTDLSIIQKYRIM